MLDRAWDRLFPNRPDFLALLKDQVDGALEAVGVLLQWMDDPREEHLRRIEEIEKRADEIRIDLSNQLAEAIETPLDREDTNTVSNRLDDVTDATKFCALQLHALSLQPEDAMKRMVENLRSGLHHLRESLENLPAHLDKAQQANRRAMHAQRDNQHVYVETLSSILDDPLPRNMLGRHETYKQLLRIGEQIQLTSKLLEHAIHKLQ